MLVGGVKKAALVVGERGPRFVFLILHSTRARTGQIVQQYAGVCKLCYAPLSPCPGARVR